MIAELTATEQILIDQFPQTVKFYLAVGRPRVVWKARVNDAGIALEERIIAYDGVTFGTDGAVVAGMTLRVGTTEGAQDLGTVRIKVVPNAGVMTVAQNSDIAWVDDAYLTAVEDYDYWTKLSRYVDTGGGKVLLLDYDMGFQGLNMPPIAIMGWPECAFLDDGAAKVKFVGNLSYPMTGATISAYSWVFPTAVPNVSTVAGSAAAPVEVVYSAATGHSPRWASLEITDNDGQVKTTRRPVFIFDRTGDNAPYSQVTIGSFKKDAASGGSSVALTVDGAASEAEFPEGAMVVLFAEEWWGAVGQLIALGTSTTSVAIGTGAKTFTTQAGLADVMAVGAPITVSVTADGTKKVTGTITSYNNSTGALVVDVTSIGGTGTYNAWTVAPHGPIKCNIGGYPYRKHIKFVGRISKETIEWGFKADGTQTVTFEAATVHEQMKAKSNPSQALEDSTAGVWPAVKDLSVKLAAYYICQWYSTLLEICDVWLPDTDELLASQDFAEGGIFKQVDDYLASAIFARACCDSCGSVYLKHDPQFLVAADRTGLVEMLDVTTRLREKLTISHPQREPINWVELCGEYYNGRDSVRVISQAPGNAYRQYGASRVIDGLVLGTQAETNLKAGAVFGALNNLWTGIPFKLLGNHLHMDVAPPGYFLHTLAEENTKRGISWTDARFVPQTIDIHYDPMTATVTVDVDADKESVPINGITGVYPTDPPVEDPPDPDPPPWDPIPVDPEDLNGYMCAFDDTNGFYWRVGGSTSWTQRNTGLINTEFLCGAVKRGWKQMQNTADPESCILFGGGEGFLALTTDAGKSWTDILPTSSNTTWVSFEPNEVDVFEFIDVDCPNDATDTIYALAKSSYSRGKIGVVFKSEDLGRTWLATYISAQGPGGGIGEYIYPIAVTTSTDYGIWQPGGTISYSGLNNATGEADGAALEATYNFAGTGQIGMEGWSGYRFYHFDFGQFTGYGWGVNEMIFNVLSKVESPSLFHDASVTISADGINWYNMHSGGLSSWSAETSSYAWGPNINFHQACPIAGSCSGWRYVRVRSALNGVGADNGTKAWIDTARIYNATRDTSYGSAWPIGLAVDLENGSRIYVTYKTNSMSCVTGGNFLRIFDSDLGITNDINLSSDDYLWAFTLPVFPRCIWQPTVTDFGNIVILYGPGLASGGGCTAIVAKFTFEDGPTGEPTLSGAPPVLEAVNVNALAAKGDGAGQLTNYIAFLSDGRMYSTPDLTDLTTWTYIGDAPFAPSKESISINQDVATTLLIGSNSAGATMIETAPNPYTVYTDETEDYPTDGVNVMVEWVV